MAREDDVSPGDIRMGTAHGRGVLIATVLGSGISFLDGFVVNVALPKIDEDLGLGVAGLQWTVSGYLLAVSALLLLGGSLGDRYGRRAIYLIGLLVFTLASVMCGVAVSTEMLVAARVVQGIGGALMIPAGLAIIQAVFHPEDRGAAIGEWTGLGAVFTALGPFVGGAFVTYVSWRWAFLVNVPIAALAWWTSMRWIPESREVEQAGQRPDVLGGTLAALGLGGATYWAIEGPSRPDDPMPLILGVAGLATLAAFLFLETRVRHPMLPLSLFRSSQFNWINVCTVIFYGAFTGGVTFLGVQLQTNLGYSPLEAGLSSFPVTVLMIALSRRFGALAQRIGPKLPMAVGPVLVAVGLLVMAQIQDGRDYWSFVFPAVLLWGLGLAMVVAPLTSAALAASDQRHIGVASAVNNAASRVGQTMAVALLPALAGMSGGEIGGARFSQGYEKALVIAALLSALAGAIALVFVSGGTHQTKSGQAAS